MSTEDEAQAVDALRTAFAGLPADEPARAARVLLAADTRAFGVYLRRIQDVSYGIGYTAGFVKGHQEARAGLDDEFEAAAKSIVPREEALQAREESCGPEREDYEGGSVPRW